MKQGAWTGCVVVVAALSAGRPDLAPADEYSSVMDGNWRNPAVWSATQWPVAGDTVTVAHDVECTNSEACATLRLREDGSVDTDTNALTIGDRFEWSGGGLTPRGGLFCDGTIELTGGATKTLSRGPLVTGGTTRHTGGTLHFSYATWSNLISSVYDLQTGDSPFSYLGSSSRFDNFGTFRKSVSTNRSDVTVAFHDHGGAIEVQAGVLAFANGHSTFTDTAIHVEPGAAFELAGATTVEYDGVLSGTGGGDVRLANGTLKTSGGVTLDLGSLALSWSGGSVDGGTVTNLTPLNLTGDARKTLATGTRWLQQRDTVQTGTGDLYLYGATWENAPGAVHDVRGDGGLMTYSGASRFDNYGTFRKSAGIGTCTVSAPFQDHAGTLDVLSGTLAFSSADSTFSNSTINVAPGATFDLSGGGAPRYDGTLTASGGGRLLLTNGTMAIPGGLTLNAPDMAFDWMGGTIDGGTLRGVTAMALSGPARKTLTTGTLMLQRRDVTHSGSGELYLYKAVWSNAVGVVYDLRGDGALLTSSGASRFDLSGTLRRSAGDGALTVEVPFHCLGGTLDVRTGTVAFPNGDSHFADTYCRVAPDAVFDLTGGSSPAYSGRLTGDGGGELRLASGTLDVPSAVTFDCSNVVFRWTGGTLDGGVVTNRTPLTLAGDARKRLYTGSRFVATTNTVHEDAGDLYLYAAVWSNCVGAVYDLRSDGTLISYGSSGRFDNRGTLMKSTGDGETVVEAPFHDENGLVDVRHGTLTFRNGQSTFSGTRCHVATGAVLDVTGGLSPSIVGRLSGEGGGELRLAAGTLDVPSSAVLDCAGLDVVWRSGSIDGGVLTNSSPWTLAGSDTKTLATGTLLVQAARTRHIGAGTLHLSSATWSNAADAVYEVWADGTVMTDYSSGHFVNCGTYEKCGGGGTSMVVAAFENLGGTVAVATGTLAFADSEVRFAGGTLDVRAGAVLDLTGGQRPTYSGVLTGAGAGVLALRGGSIEIPDALVFDLPSNTLVWAGGTFQGGTVTNRAAVRFERADRKSIAGGERFVQAADVTQTGDGELYLNNATWVNAAGAVHELRVDAVVIEGYSAGLYENRGTFRKAAGEGIADVAHTFLNAGGTVEAAAGTLRFLDDFTHQDGTVRLDGGNVSFARPLVLTAGRIEGRGLLTAATLTSHGTVAPGRSIGELTLAGDYVQAADASLDVEVGAAPSPGPTTDRLNVTGSATLAGRLIVRTAPGYTPRVGDRFAFLACAGRNGEFDVVDAPGGVAGWAVDYYSTGAVLRVTAVTDDTLGVPIDWLIAHGWTSNFAAAVLSNPDGDPMLTWEEWYADTDPTNPLSYLRIAAVTNAAAAASSIYFASSSNRLYTLRARSALTTGVWSDVPGAVDIRGSGAATRLSDLIPPAPPRYYRLAVRVPSEGR